MDENKTGVWIQTKNGQQLKYNSHMMKSFNVGDIVEVDNDDVYAKFKIEVVELKNASRIVATYTIKPQLRIDRRHFHGVTRFHDAEPIEMDVYENDRALLIVPPWYKKKQYRKQNIRSTEASITITRKNQQETMNEKCEIRTGTITTDKIQVDTVKSRIKNMPILEPNNYLGNCASTKSWMPESNIKPITATSEAEKNFKKEYYATFGATRGLRSEIPTLDDLSGEMNEIRKALKYQREAIEEIMNTLAVTKKEKEMYTDKLKNKIKKVIYVDKEMTVKEPVLDGNGKQLEEGGKPVTKDKLYRGMVKVVWNCGTETVAYTSMYDRFNREEGFKTCVLKYLFGNAGVHDAVDFWTNKYVKYPSSCIEVTENLCKLGKILEKDKGRKDNQKGLPHAKFFVVKKEELMFDPLKESYEDENGQKIKEFKKLAKKYFPELKGKEIYINDNKSYEIFVAIK